MSSAAKPAPAGNGPGAREERPLIPRSVVRRLLGGFLLSGMLLSFLGAILPAWQAHLSLDFTAVGKYFLCFGLGVVFGIRPARLLVSWKGYTASLILACALASASFAGLIFVPPPSPAVLRLTGLFFIGFSAAMLNTGLFHAAAPFYRRDRAAVVNLAGALFGIGCLSTALLLALFATSVGASAALLIFAAVSSGFAILFARTGAVRTSNEEQPPHRRLGDLNSPLAFLLALLLFFQIGNEWSVAGWLPIFLIRSLGSSPLASLLLLAWFWAALIAGRFVAQAILPRANHTRLLIGSVLVELLGYLLLSMTNNTFGALMGILALSAGFALVYPLVAGKIGNRLRGERQPDFFHGAFTFAFAGALVTPWLLGYVAQSWGIRAAILLPLLGTVIVFLLLLAIMLESFLSAGRSTS